jgi:RimJ/RimL family protein N-acetyltransferase
LGQDGDEVGLGFWIAKAHRGHGYAAEALRALLSMACTLGHKRIIASQLADSPSSGDVLESVGFKPIVEVRSRLAQMQSGEAPLRLSPTT